MPKRTEFEVTAQNFADSLTAEQMITLYQIIDPISDVERAKLDKMSDEELLTELTAE